MAGGNEPAGGERSDPERALEVSDAPIEAQLARERQEAVVAVEAERSIVAGVDDDRTGAEMACSGDGPDQRVPEQIGTEASPVLLTVKRKLGQEQNGDGIGLAAAKPRRGNFMLDAPHGQRVVADNPAIPAEHPCGSRAGGGGDGCRAHQPIIELRYPTVETDGIMAGRIE